MDDTLRIAAIWFHILGIALFVGPQFFLAFAWVPASRQIADVPARLRAMRTLTTRFGWIGGIGLLMILLAGGYLIGNWRDYYNVGSDAGFTGYRYGVLFIIKMSLLVVMLIVVGIHTFVFGPRLIDVMEAQAANQATDAAVRKARTISMILSIAGLALVLAIMVLGVMMNTFSYSLQST
ncbi:MAG: CopD family protein [Chloroflexi bacterium]|nr:CopD family protein [Chloroflexota bacterium]